MELGEGWSVRGAEVQDEVQWAHKPLLPYRGRGVTHYTVVVAVLQKARNARIWNSSQFRYLLTIFLHLPINFIYLQQYVL